MASRTQLQRLLPQGWHARPGVLIVWALSDWGVIGLSWAAIATFDNLLVSVVGIVAIASRLHALGVILHDACHRRSREKSAAWWLVEALAGWPIGSTIEAMRYHHLRHHRASGMHSDPYRNPLQARGGLVRGLLAARGALLPFWWSLRAFFAPFALLAPRLRTFYGRAFLQDRSGRDLTRHPEVLACLRADLAQAAAHCAAGVAIIAFALPFVSCYLVPWMLGGVLNARRVIVEHAPVENRDCTRATMLATTFTHDAGRLANAVLYPHNVGFHQAHHLYPTVAFGHLPRLQSALDLGQPAR